MHRIQRKLIYLASPYSHPDPNMREARWYLACVSAARLIKKGYRVFSPIAHSHPIALHGNLPPMDESLWSKQNAPYLAMADHMVILDLPLWNLSRGIVEEVKVARKRGIPVTVWAFGNKGLGRPL